MTAQLRRATAAELPSLLHDPLDPETVEQARIIVDNVRARGEEALREYAEKFDGLEPGAPLLIGSAELKQVFHSLSDDDQNLLLRTAERINVFAKAQRGAVNEMEMDIPGGRAGHTIAPVYTAGCYAPGGGFPLPSSVLMTAVTARAAGVRTVVVASPKPEPITLGAAFAAGADCLLSVGGAHAIAALAFGVGPVPKCDVVVGPGNKWVTAAKHLVSSQAGIDMLAGPSELTILADSTAEPDVVAADLLAQAEHGFDSIPILVTTDEALIEKTNAEIAKQIETLPTRETAQASISKGFAILARDWDQAIGLVDRIAPEHLELMCEDAGEVAKVLSHYGGLFIGANSAEVLGDYGAGPNHTLPTGGTARFTGGLSVMHFLRIRTWMRLDNLDEAREILFDARDLARHEKLEAHARSAEKRIR